MTTKVPLVLDQDKMFIKSTTPFDFNRNMGQYALEITYTNGDTQMLTTPSLNPNCHGTHEFESLAELTAFRESINK